MRPKCEKVAALAAVRVLTGGSAAAAGRLLGIPGRSVRKWRQEGRSDVEIQELVEQAVAEARPGLILEASEIVVLAAGIVASGLKALAERVEPLQAKELRDVSVLGAVWIDKLKIILEGQAGSRHADYSGRAVDPLADDPLPDDP